MFVLSYSISYRATLSPFISLRCRVPDMTSWGLSKIYRMTWPVETENSCKELCSPRMKSLQRKPIAPSPFPWKSVSAPYS